MQDVIARVSFGVELNTQQPLDKLDADGLRGKQLREDAMYSFASNGGVNSKWCDPVMSLLLLLLLLLLVSCYTSGK